LAAPASTAESRVAKYEHRIGEALNLGRRESALLCVLLLRGPQTAGELRVRCERLHQFDDLGELISTLQRMSEYSPPLVRMFPRQPGTKESRYAHLLSGDAEEWQSSALPEHAVQAEAEDASRIAVLETKVAILERDVAELKRQIAEGAKQSG
jgi:uncharacterized protein YceH (UPF0502 family)